MFGESKSRGSLMMRKLLQSADAEENWLEVVLGEKLCELEGVQKFVEWLQKVVAQMRTYQGL